MPVAPSSSTKAALFAAVLERAAANTRASLADAVARFGSAGALLARILGDPAGPATGDQDEAPGGHRDPHPGRLFAAAVALAADPALPELRGPLLQVLAGHLADLVARGQHDGRCGPTSTPGQPDGCWSLS